MGLFVDGDVTGVDQLVAFDENVLNVARMEGIDLGKKLATAQQRVSQDLGQELIRPNTEGTAVRVDQIIATPGLRLCHVWRTLELVYRFAFVSQGLERYQRTADLFSREADRAFRREAETGLLYTREPLPRPPGPDLSLVDGTGPAGISEYYVAWMGASGRASSISEAKTIINPTGQAIRVRHGLAPRYATSWLVFASETGGRPRRQAGPHPIGTDWTTTFAELVNGDEPTEDLTGDGRVRLLPKFERG